jgi:hypothetical protein
MALFVEHEIELDEKKHGEMKRTLTRRGWSEMAKIHGTLLSRSYRARYFGGKSKDGDLQDSYDQLVKLRELIAAVPKPTRFANPS